MMTTKDRLEHLAVILTTTEHSPSDELHSLGLRLLAQELDDLALQTRRQEEHELESFHSLGPPCGDGPRTGRDQCSS